MHGCGSLNLLERNRRRRSAFRARSPTASIPNRLSGLVSEPLSVKETFKRLHPMLQPGIVRMHGAHHLQDLQRLVHHIQMLKDCGHSHHGPEMPGIQRQRPADVTDCRAVHLHMKQRARTGVPAFGKVGCVVGQGRQVFQGDIVPAIANGLPPPLKQHIHGCRTRFRPLPHDLPFELFPVLCPGIREPVQHELDLRHLRNRRTREPKDQDAGHKNGFANAWIDTHNLPYSRPNRERESPGLRVRGVPGDERHN